MTTSTFSAAPLNTGDTIFRAWGSGLSTALAAVGLVKTSDTGQINWATVTAPAGASTQQGYEVWRFTDTLQATAPIFIRIGYGSGSASSYPALWFTIGKGSDGAGTITSVIQAAQQITVSGSSATASNWYISSDGSSLLLAAAQGYYTIVGNFLLVIERSRDAAGAATGVGGLTVWSAGASPTIRTWNYSGSSLHTGIVRWPVQPPTTTTADNPLASGGKAPMYPAAVHDGVGNFWQPRAVLVGMRQDTGTGAAITVPGFGTYLPLGAGATGFDGTQGAYADACVRWQ